jgi:hypothetical protein
VRFDDDGVASSSFVSSARECGFFGR